MSGLSYLLTIILVVLTSVYLYLKWMYGYFARHGVAYETPHLFWGNIQGINKKFSLGSKVKMMYHKFSGEHKVFGLFLLMKPVTVICDLDLIKSVLIKDFNKLSDRGSFYNERDDPLSANLFNLPVDRWRGLRAKLSPSFSSGKLKSMTGIVSGLCDKLVDKLNENPKQVNIGNIFSRYTTDVIGNTAFGLDCNSLDDPQSEFLEKGNMVFHPKPRKTPSRILKIAFAGLSRYLGLKGTPSEVHDFFYNVAKETVSYREKEEIHREDFLNSLLQMKRDNVLSFNEVAAQMFLFQLAGYETSSTTLTYVVYELTKNAEIQERAREEVNSVLERHGNKITYDSVFDMPYLDCVVKEALRKYPPGTITFRRVVVDCYELPGTEMRLKRNDVLIIPIRGIQMDPNIYPEPETFKPERFLPEETKKRHPMSFLAFGEGPRICIGIRFAEMEIKMALVKLLLRFRMEPGEGFPEQLEFKTGGIILTPKNDIHINFVNL